MPCPKKVSGTLHSDHKVLIHYGKVPDTFFGRKEQAGICTPCIVAQAGHFLQGAHAMTARGQAVAKLSLANQEINSWMTRPGPIRRIGRPS